MLIQANQGVIMGLFTFLVTMFFYFIGFMVGIYLVSIILGKILGLNSFVERSELCQMLSSFSLVGCLIYMSFFSEKDIEVQDPVQKEVIQEQRPVSDIPL